MDPCKRHNENNVIWLHPLSAMQVLLDYQLIIALPLAYIMAKRCVFVSMAYKLVFVHRSIESRPWSTEFKCICQLQIIINSWIPRTQKTDNQKCGAG